MKSLGQSSCSLLFFLLFFFTGFLVFSIFLSSYESTLFLVWNTEAFPGRRLISSSSYSSSTEHLLRIPSHPCSFS